jgi:hypothetical protein
MSSIQAVNYSDNLFVKPDLSPILGPPDYESLYLLNTDLRANAVSVHSNLGGGAHGHLGLVMTAQQYQIVSPVPYLRPEHPGALTIPNGTARHLAEQMERDWKEALRVFHEVRGVEKALTQQVVAAVEETYLLSFKSRVTGQFNGNLLDILNHLLATYGEISPAQLSSFEKDVIEMTYDPTTPIDVVFQKVEDLMMYGDFAQCPFTAEQSIQRAYNIINSTGLYKDYIKTWSRRPRVDRTWENFKEHFRIAYLELKETGELTLTEAGYGTGTANLVNEIISRMHSELDHRANIIHDPHVAPDPPATAEANAATNTDKPLLEQILAQNQALLRCLECNSNTSNQNRSNTSRPPRTSTGPRQGNPRTPLAAHYNKYCWSHGRCNHVGSECKSKAPGHKDTATMEDKMGGSNYACSVL